MVRGRSLTLLALAWAGIIPVTGCLAAEETIPTQMVTPIIVTGTKTTTEIGSVPVSVAVVSGQQIEDRGDRNLDDVVTTMANVSTINLGGHTSYPVIRGISGLSDQSPASIVIDGVSPRGLGLDNLLDVEQVEVLRGPQGTLYGQNTIPGVVTVTTRAPGKHWDGWGSLNGSTYGGGQQTLSAAAAAGGPVSSTVGIRLAAAGTTSTGWRTNVVTDDNHSAARKDAQAQGSLVWDLGDGWDARLTGLGARYRTSGDQYASLELAARHETQNSDPGALNNDVLSGGLTLQRASEQGTFTAITGASATRDVFELDIDFTPVPGSVLRKDSTHRELSQEVRYGGGLGLRSWLVGIYAAGAEQKVDAPLTIAPNPFLPPGLAVERGGTQNSSTAAAFGQAGLPLGPGWTLTVGLRVDYAKQTVDYSYRDNLTAGFDYAASRSDTLPLPKASVAYAWSDDVLTWLSAARGSTPGGYNMTPASVAEIDGGYDAETAWTYEVGQRVAALDRRVRLSCAAFLTNYQDKQVTVLLPPTMYLIRNAARARITGVESDLSVNVAPGVDVLAGIGALRPVFIEYDSGTSDLTGNHLPMAPSYDGYLGLQWRDEVGLFMRVDLSAIGSYYADDQNLIDQDAYRLLAAKIGYETTAWSVFLWGRNLSDSVYWTRASATQSGQQVAVSGEPRSVGITGLTRF